MVISKFGALKQKLNYQYLIQVFAKLSFVFILVWSSIGSATTLQKLDIDQVAKGANFIFEGEVLTHEVRNESIPA